MSPQEIEVEAYISFHPTWKDLEKIEIKSWGDSPWAKNLKYNNSININTQRKIFTFLCYICEINAKNRPFLVVCIQIVNLKSRKILIIFVWGNLEKSGNFLLRFKTPCVYELRFYSLSLILFSREMKKDIIIIVEN